MNYYIYLILAFLCFIGEMFTMDFALTCFGLGLIGAAVAAWLGLSFIWQALIFAAVSLACFFSVRPLARKVFYRKQTPASNIDALIGREITLANALDAQSKTGYVKIDGDDWRVTCDQALPAGAKAVVVKIDGATLVIAKK